MALTPPTGWGVLHLFCRLAPDFDANALRKAVSAAEADGYQVVPVAVLGHKADLGLMALGWILFGGVRGFGRHRGGFGGRWQRRMQERWEKMSPEEREKFRGSMRDRCGHVPADAAPKA